MSRAAVGWVLGPCGSSHPHVHSCPLSREDTFHQPLGASLVSRHVPRPSLSACTPTRIQAERPRDPQVAKPQPQPVTPDLCLDGGGPTAERRNPGSPRRGGEAGVWGWGAVWRAGRPALTTSAHAPRHLRGLASVAAAGQTPPTGTSPLGKGDSQTRVTQGAATDTASNRVLF